MRITDAFLQSGGADQVRKVSGVKPGSKSEGDAKVRSTSSDSVSISGKARSMAETSAPQLKARVEAMPDMREDKIAEVRSRIESGYYESEEFQDLLADKLLNQFGITKNS